MIHPVMPSEMFATGLAVDALEEFIALYDRVYSDPDRPLNEFHDLARGQALMWAMLSIRADHERGRVGVGRHELVELDIVRAVLQPNEGLDGHATVVVSSCLDRSDFELVDHGGVPVQAGHPERIAVDWVLLDVGTADYQWTVARTTLAKELPHETC